VEAEPGGDHNLPYHKGSEDSKSDPSRRTLRGDLSPTVNHDRGEHDQVRQEVPVAPMACSEPGATAPEGDHHVEEKSEANQEKGSGSRSTSRCLSDWTTI